MKQKTQKTEVGIVGYGAYVPTYYVLSSAIDERATHLGLSQKALACWDEDSVTMGVQSALMAMKNARVSASSIGALYIGSESPAYAVNPSSTIVADMLSMDSNYHAVDLQFACKAATAGLQMMMAQIASSNVPYGLIIGADKSQAKKGDVLEWSAGSAGAALLIGKNKVLARVLATASVSSDTPDFWRREGQLHPTHGGRFTGKPAYFRHVLEATQKVLAECGLSPSDFAHAVFHMPNGVFPIQAGEQLGFTRKQLDPGMTVLSVGNPYSASSLLGLTAVLDISKPGDLLLMTSYGSGAGSDSFVFEVTNTIENYPKGDIQKLFGSQKMVSSEQYLHTGRWR
jgi:hydroxymethylglutaryl-CoA synthase